MTVRICRAKTGRNIDFPILAHRQFSWSSPVLAAQDFSVDMNVTQSPLTAPTLGALSVD